MQLKVLGIQGTTSVNAAATAIRGLTIEEAAAALATTELTEEEMAAALVKAGFSSATATQTAESIVEAQAIEAQAAATIGLSGAEVSATGATTGLTTAFRGLKAAFASNPFGFIITAAITLLTLIPQVVGWFENMAEEERRASEDSAKNAAERSNNLSNLIGQYEELAKSGKRDKDTLSQIEDIQSQIVESTGNQVSNLDLVNGKLDKELEKLKKISKEQIKPDLSTYSVAANDKMDEGFDNQYGGKSDINGFDLMFAPANIGKFGKGTFKEQAGIMESLYNIFAKYSEKWYKTKKEDVEAMNRRFHDFYTPGGTSIGIDFRDMTYVNQINAINDALEYLENVLDDKSDNDFYKRLTRYRDAVQKFLGESQTSLETFTQAFLKTTDFDEQSIQSVDDFSNLYQKVIDKISSDDTIKRGLEEGFIDQKWIEEQAKNYLSGIEQYSDIYKRWEKQIESEIPDLGKKIEGFSDWFNGLTTDEQDIVFRITEDYSHSNIEGALNSLEQGGNVDLTLRPTIDTSELKKVGWDEEDGGQATVFTSTYSNKEGNKAINFTPIIVDEKGNYKGVLSPEELEEYAMGVINGTREDDLHLQIGAEFTGENAVDDAVAAAKRIHELQDWFYLKGDPSEWALDQWKQAVADWEVPEADKIHFSDLIADEDFSDKVDGYKSKITSLQEALSKLRNGEMSESDEIELFSQFPELASQTGNLEDAIISLINSTKTDAFADFDEQMAYMDTDDDVAALNALKNSFEGLATVQESIDKTKALSAELSNLKSTFEDIKGVIDSYNENGYLTIDNIEKIMSLEPEYVNLLIDENGQINLNNQAYKDYIATKAKSLLVNELKSLYDSIMGMSMEEAQAYANAEAFKVETRSVQDLLTATTQLYLVQAHIKDKENNTTAWTDALKRSFSTAANYAAMVDGYISSLSTSTNEFSQQTNESTSALEAQKEALEKQKKALEDEKDALKDAKDALEEYKSALEGAQDDIQSLIDLVIDYIKQIKEDEKKALEEQIDRLEKQKDALDEQKDKYAEVIDKKKEALRLAKEEKEAADELAAKQKSVAKSRLALEVAGLDDSSAGRKAQKQAADELSTNQKDLNDFLYDQAYEKEVDALDKQQEKFEETIEEQKKKIDKQIEHIEKQIAKIDKYLNNTRKLYIDACRMIDNEGKKLYNKLWKYVYKHTSMTKSEFNHLWSSAQAAIKKYQKDNESLVSVMEKIQNKIYSTDKKIQSLSTQIGKVETKINNLDTAINNTSDAIKNTSNSIKSVSSSVRGLGTSIANYIKQLDELEKREKNRYKWYFKYHGRVFKSRKSSKEDAIQDIYHQILKAYPREVFDGSGVRRGIKAYAKGTRNSPAGLSITQEQGLEAIFGKLQSGQYTMMPQGSQVFTSGQTDNLFDFSSDPQGFVKGLLDKFSYANFFASRQGTLASAIKNISTVQNKMNGDTSVSAPISIHIQGDATQSTVNALKKEASNIKEDTIKTILHYASFNKKNRW